MLGPDREKRFFLVMTILFMACFHAFAEGREGLLPYQDPGLPVNVRVLDLVSRMTLAEKIAQLGSTSPAIDHLGVAAYNYWNEALHGVVATGVTSFPQSIALSATWNPDLIYRVASAISDEARVVGRLQSKGLTYWCPVINMARDPRWGRTEETYGEDPYLASALAMEFIRGMQGTDQKYRKTIATVKHFACNNVDNDRHWISSNVDERSLMEYYLPAFKDCITKSGVSSVMSAYNALNGVPCPVNRRLLTNILRNEWGFTGFVVSDCDAVNDVFKNHNYVLTAEDATALSIRSGNDLNCGETYQLHANTAIVNGLMDSADVDSALVRIFTARFLLGEFDPPDMVPYSAIPDSMVDCRKHRDLALLAAQEAIVLLKNQNAILPLNKDSLTRIAVIGPIADWMQLGAYSGIPVVWNTALHAIIHKFSRPGKYVDYAPGSPYYGPEDTAACNLAVNLAKNADVAVIVCGTDPEWAHEEKDRTTLDLPAVQDSLIMRVSRANPKTVVVLVSGYPLSVNGIYEQVPGLISAWYNGQAQGTAIADVLFGDYNPGGKLTSTWYRSVDDLPPMDHYDVKENRTYLYFKGSPLFPFGYGLSYSTFEYDSLLVSAPLVNSGDSVTLQVTVKNTGNVAGDEVVQFYIRHLSSGIRRPEKELKGFKRIHLAPGDKTTITFTLSHSALAYYNEEEKAYTVAEGDVELMVGSSSADIRLNDQVHVSAAVSGLAYRIDPYAVNEAESFETKSKPVEIVPTGQGGQSISVMADNDFLEFKNLNFGEGATIFTAMIKLDARSTQEGALELRLDHPYGPVCGLLNFNTTGQLAGYRLLQCNIKEAVGVRNLYLHFINAGGGYCAMDWFQFGNPDPVPEKFQNGLRIFPNPATSHFWLTLNDPVASPVQLELLNLEGIVVWSGMVRSQSADSGNFLLDLSDTGVKPGMYILRCLINGKINTSKLCILP